LFPVCAMASASVAATLTAPIDLVKTRLQTQGLSARYKGVLDCVRQLYGTGGLRTLFDGAGARVMWLTPNLAITMTVYEFITQHFVSRQQR